MVRPPNSPRLRARFSVRVRRHGGSLSMTIPKYIVRAWKLEHGARLVVRSTDQGILLFPRFFLPLVHGPDARPPSGQTGAKDRVITNRAIKRGSALGR